MTVPAILHLNEIIAPAVSMLGFEFIACEIYPQTGRAILRVFIDSPHGVSLKDCEKVSRQISSLLDVEDPIGGKYTLEVSSPGADRVLRTEEHFNRFIGRHIKVKLRVSQNDRRNFTGLLQSVQDGNIRVMVDKDTFVLSILEIEKANLVPDL